MSRRLRLMSDAVILCASAADVAAQAPGPLQPDAGATAGGKVRSRMFLSYVLASRPAANSNGSIYWGVALAGAPGDMKRLSAWERDVAGKGISILHWGHDWDDHGGYHAWSDAPADDARRHGAIPMITWIPEGGNKGRWQLRKIIDGEHDGYIREFAKGVKGWGHPLFLRMMHEMNGAWGYPWQEDSNGNRRGEFVQAWRHVVDIFRSEGSGNVSFVWCPNKEYPNSTNPTFASLYPGDAYVGGITGKPGVP